MFEETRETTITFELTKYFNYRAAIDDWCLFFFQASKIVEFAIMTSVWENVENYWVRIEWDWYNHEIIELCVLFLIVTLCWCEIVIYDEVEFTSPSFSPATLVRKPAQSWRKLILAANLVMCSIHSFLEQDGSIE